MTRNVSWGQQRNVAAVIKLQCHGADAKKKPQVPTVFCGGKKAQEKKGETKSFTLNRWGVAIRPDQKEGKLTLGARRG